MGEGNKSITEQEKIMDNPDFIITPEIISFLLVVLFCDKTSEYSVKNEIF